MRSRLLSQAVTRSLSSASEEKAILPLRVSRLRLPHALIAASRVPPLDAASQIDRAVQITLFGRHGLSSGVQLASLWPAVEEVEEEMTSGLLMEYADAVREVDRIRADKERAKKARVAELEKMKKEYPAAVAKFEASLIKAERENDAKEEQLERRIREIHEYFGYWMDPKDPRFEVMLQQKEAEERKAERLAKRAEMQKKKIAQVLSS